MNDDPKIKRIRELNDLLRTTFLTGRVILTEGIRALPDEDREAVITNVREFSDFSFRNDPHGEHDFGDFTHNGQKIYWKIDYYDKAERYGSEDPSDPKQTTRVLTILLASEY